MAVALWRSGAVPRAAVLLIPVFVLVDFILQQGLAGHVIQFVAATWIAWVVLRARESPTRATPAESPIRATPNRSPGVSRREERELPVLGEGEWDVDHCGRKVSGAARIAPAA